MKYYIIAGELSGDKHSALIMKYLKVFDKEAQFRFWGGDNMLGEGGTMVRHIKDLAFMGVQEVAVHLRTILGNISFCKKDILAYKPDAVILTDYPGFNLRIAGFAHKNNIPVIYYIAPQVWAWKKGRIKTMRKVIDRLYCILPFEKEFFHKHDMKAEYYGNPLLDEITMFRENSRNREEFLAQYSLGSKPVIALLPGSRTQEIKALLPVQLSLVDKYPEYDFVIAGVSSQPESLYRKYIGNKNVKLIFDRTYDILNVAHAGIITSGTATLETALFNVPQVVCYKTSGISYMVGKYVVKITSISLVNIILKHKAVVELIQNECNETALDSEFRRLCFKEDYRHSMQCDYDALQHMLGSNGASSSVAHSITEYLSKK